MLLRRLGAGFTMAQDIEQLSFLGSLVPFLLTGGEASDADTVGLSL